MIEIRLFGTLRVRRADGTYTAAQEWRTAMTRGLLALVALRAPNPVPVDVALDMIWPGVEASKARARLRTAASQIRKVVGTNCLQREGDSLVLRNAWVDTDGFGRAVAQVRRHLIMGDVQPGLAAARDALSLYAGDVCEDWPYTDWIDASRTHLRQLHQRLLEEVAEAALEVGSWAEAVTLAERAARIDPCSERACRVLMRAHDSFGETSEALLAYERCRTALVDSVGADPSDKTESLHRSLLRRLERPPPVPFVGRADLLRLLQKTASQAFSANTPALVHLVGPPGAGKSRLLDELALQVDARVVLVRLQAVQGRGEGSAYDQIARHVAGGESAAANAGLRVTDPTLLCVDEAQWGDSASLQRLAREVDDLSAPLVLLVAGADPAITSTAPDKVWHVGSLTRSEVAALAEAVFGRRLPQTAIEALQDYSGGLPGPLIEEALRWRAAGLLGPPDNDSKRRAERPTVTQEPPERLLESSRHRLGPEGMQVLEVLTVLGAATEVDSLRHLVSAPDVVEGALDVLHDAGVVQREGAMWSIADQSLRDAAYGWLRPSVRRELHRRIAMAPELPLTRESRLRHWLDAGIPTRAIEGDHGAAEDLTARVDEQLARIDAEACDPTAWHEQARAGVAEVDLSERFRVEVLAGCVLSHRSVPRAVDAFLEATRLADQIGDAHLQIDARSHLVGVLLAARRLGDADDAGKRAAAIADAVDDDRALARSLLMIGEAAMWAGQAQSAVHLLERAWQVAGPNSPLQGQITGWMARALHQVGGSGADLALEYARRLADQRRLAGWRLIAAECALEDAAIGDARRHLKDIEDSRERLTALDQVRLHLLLGRAAAAAGMWTAAAEALDLAVQEGLASGAMLPVAEAAARLAVLQAGHDTPAARRTLQIAHQVSHDGPNAREQSVLLLCQAQVLRGEGEHEGALGLARAAQGIARRAGLVWRVAEAQTLLNAFQDHSRPADSAA